ncbi:MAG: type II secretion system protein, partial [Nautiliaceae bacterium]
MKKSFTLVEILISIGILSVLFLAMSNVISGLKISKTTLKAAYENSSKEELFIKTLYGDIINAKEIKIQHSHNNKNYDILFLHTKNSLYKNIYPYVIWYVSKNG